MSKPQSAPNPSSTPVPDEAIAYTSAMRVFGGIAWGTLTAVLVAMVLIIIPQVPRTALWAVLPLWMVLSGVGIVIQWSVARGACPKCGTVQTVPIMGKRCPKCRSYLKAIQREIVRAA